MTRNPTEREMRLRRWLQAHDITFAALGKALGISDSRARVLVMSETIPTRLHARLCDLGFPKRLLPPAKDRKRGPVPKIPRFPRRPAEECLTEEDV